MATYHLYDDCSAFSHVDGDQLVVYVSPVPDHDPDCETCLERAAKADSAELASIDLPALLDNIIVCAHHAKAALADEHEGNLNKEVDALCLDANKVRHLIKNW